VEEEDVTRAKNSLKSMMTLHVDGSSAIAEEIGRHTLCYGRRIDKVEMFARIDAVRSLSAIFFKLRTGLRATENGP
jgi:processing peptidase subunit beta